MELTRVEYEKRLAELQGQLEELKSANIVDAPWGPQLHEEYWYLESVGEADCTTWEDWESDRRRLASGNIFKTQEDAEFFAEQLRVYAELRKFAEPKTRPWDCVTYHYYIACDCDESGKFEDPTPRYYVSTNRGAELYFESEERAKKAIDAVGADRVKKYYLHIED